MSSWHSYPSIYALGHAALGELFDGDVLVEEKVDGSQFSWGRFGEDLKLRSKGKEMYPDAPEKMFQKAVDTVIALDLHDGWTYRGEFLSKPKHNALAYDRVPKGNLIVFDINVGDECYLSYEEKKAEAERIGMEIVPIMRFGQVSNQDEVLAFLKKESILGGQKVEGVVVKNYARFGRDKKVLMGKYVSEQFKEVHKSSWKDANPTQGDIVQRLIQTYKTEARWNKAILHLNERGELEGSPRDIGKLIMEAKADIEKECEEEIKECLYKWAIKNVARGCVAGLPEWYKKKLLEIQFSREI